MKKYIIWSPEFRADSGGITVLHKLCHMINTLGYEAYLWPSKGNRYIYNTNGRYNTTIATPEMLDDSIVIYPEIVTGNPLNAKHVVRWILNIPGVIGGDGKFDEREIIYYYSKSFAEWKKDIKILHVIELYDGLFRNKNLKRNGCCFVNRRNKGKPIYHEPENAVEITDTTPSEKLVNIFNRAKYFYSYDPSTFLTIQAALCGCISIMVPYDNVTADEWINLNPTRKYGIAYGRENIEHAIRTMNYVKPNMQFIEKKNYESVKNFIEETQEIVFKRDQKKITNYNNTNAGNNQIKEVNLKEQLYIAEFYIEEQKFKDAKEILKKLLLQFPNNIDILNNLFVVAIDEEDTDTAIDIANQILSIDSQNTLILENLKQVKLAHRKGLIVNK